MYIVVSFAHQNTSMEVRERLHFSDEESIKILPILKNICYIDEVMLLSTCNRCEIYAFIDLDSINLSHANLDSINTDSMESNKENVTNCNDKKSSVNLDSIESVNLKKVIKNITDNFIKALAEYKNIDIKKLNSPQILYDDSAIRHVFCVASALVSLVVGETQISGQLKASFKLSSESGFSKKWLDRLITYAFKCAAAVRSGTDISKNPVSIASIMATLAVEFVQNRAIKSPKILIIGVGEMGKLSLKHLIKHKFSITLCNRTMKNAQILLESVSKNNDFKAQIADFSTLNTLINEHNIIISAVAGGVIITENMLKKRKFDRIFFDLSIPRNISFGSHSFGNTAVKSSDKKLDSILQNIDVVYVDDLKKRARKHIESRSQNLQMALKIVDKYVEEFNVFLHNLELDPIIKNMRYKAKMASLKHINRAIKKGYIPESLRDNVVRLAHSIFNEFLHTPTMNLRAISEGNDADIALESIVRFFK